MTIGNKILVGFGVALALLLAIGIVAYRSTSELVEVSGATAQAQTRIQALEELLVLLTDMETGLRGYLLTDDPTYLEPFKNGSKEAHDRLRSVGRSLEGIVSQSRASALDTTMRLRLAGLQEALDVRREKGSQAALLIVKNSRDKKQMDDVRAAVDDLEREESDLLQKRQDQIGESARTTKATIVSVSTIAFIVVGVLGLLIQRSIARPLSAYMAAIKRVGKGDLRATAESSGRDELAQLANSLNQMVSGLRGIAEQTRAATIHLSTATAEIVASTQEQAASTGEQAAAVQQTTVTMEEIRQSGVQIVERAKQVATSAQSTASATTSGLTAVQNTGRAMESIREQAEAVAENVIRLSEKTQAVGEIIASVNDIAEQSHLLALNAAIEAASAGEHGRSFTVIASEIKALAAQSKEATLQVRSILGEIQRGINSSVMLTEEAVKRIESGKQHSETADRAIRQLADNIQQSVQAFQQIVAGSNQQHIGFEQVLQAIKNIGQASQQNAIATRQLEKAASNLNALGQQLKTMGETYLV